MCYIKDLKKEIKDNKEKDKASGSIWLRAEKLYKYDTPYTCYIMDFSLANNLIKMTIAIEFQEGEYASKTFSYPLYGAGAYYFDNFLYNFLPNYEGRITSEMVLGRKFVGKIIKNNYQYDTLIVLDTEDVEKEVTDENDYKQKEGAH